MQICSSLVNEPDFNDKNLSKKQQRVIIRETYKNTWIIHGKITFAAVTLFLWDYEAHQDLITINNGYLMLHKKNIFPLPSTTTIGE